MKEHYEVRLQPWSVPDGLNPVRENNIRFDDSAPTPEASPALRFPALISRVSGASVTGRARCYGRWTRGVGSARYDHCTGDGSSDQIKPTRDEIKSQNSVIDLY
ncbi:hypothetical protein EVAR_67831_1 [Eumeta japonica]|uniref:Uncharacterized protein n=1 Tax=Eumeta variegata TaxID=151549 RepID=A0A4C1ZVR8_EUMVA|nr:hypothetical protein EVAR_67831_1 [Eumeta japonica]